MTNSRMASQVQNSCFAAVNRGRGGFTLVELLVALALTVILLTIVAQVFYQAGQATSIALGRVNGMQVERGVVTAFDDDDVVGLGSILMDQEWNPTNNQYLCLSGGMQLFHTSNHRFVFEYRRLNDDPDRRRRLYWMDKRGVDDDGDGAIDEDWHDGEDNDNDGKTDEDGGGTIGVFERDPATGNWKLVSTLLPDRVLDFEVVIYCVDKDGYPVVIESDPIADGSKPDWGTTDANTFPAGDELCSEKAVMVELRILYSGSMGESRFILRRAIAGNTGGDAF